MSSSFTECSKLHYVLTLCFLDSHFMSLANEGAALDWDV